MTKLCMHTWSLAFIFFSINFSFARREASNCNSCEEISSNWHWWSAFNCFISYRCQRAFLKKSRQNTYLSYLLSKFLSVSNDWIRLHVVNNIIFISTRAKNRLEIWNCSFFVYTILNFPRFFSAESSPSKVQEIQNSVNKKCTISEF